MTQRSEDAANTGCMTVVPVLKPWPAMLCLCSEIRINGELTFTGPRSLAGGVCTNRTGRWRWHSAAGFSQQSGTVNAHILFQECSQLC